MLFLTEKQPSSKLWATEMITLVRPELSLLNINYSWNLKTLQWTPNFSRRGPEDPQIWKPGYISAYPSGTSNYSPFTFPQPTPQKLHQINFVVFIPSNTANKEKYLNEQ